MWETPDLGNLKRIKEGKRKNIMPARGKNENHFSKE